MLQFSLLSHYGYCAQGEAMGDSEFRKMCNELFTINFNFPFSPLLLPQKLSKCPLSTWLGFSSTSSCTEDSLKFSTNCAQSLPEAFFPLLTC